MDELEILKNDWKKREAEFPALSNQQIGSMLLQKSSTIVKWIFMVSLLEFTLPHLLLLLPSMQQNLEFYKELPVYPFLIAKTVIYYTGVFYFIRQFYLRYREISILDNVKDLMNKIIATRKSVRNYVIFCLSMAFLFVLVVIVGIYLSDTLPTMLDGEEVLQKYSIEAAKTILIISMAITGTFVLGFMALVYYLLYGLLLRRLFRNYRELKESAI